VKKLLIPLFVFLWVLLAAMPWARADQLLSNADFQTDTNTNDVPDGWCWGGTGDSLPTGVTANIDSTEVDYDVTLASTRSYAQIAQVVDMSGVIAADDVLVFSVWAQGTTGAGLQIKVEYWTAQPGCGSGDHTNLVHQIKSAEFALTGTKTWYKLGTEVPSGASLTWVSPAIIFQNNSGGTSSVTAEISASKLEHRNDLHSSLKNLLSLKQSTFDASDGTGGTGWQTRGTGTITLDQVGIDPDPDGPVKEGVRSLGVTVDGSATGQGFIMAPTTAVTASQSYALSCQIKGTAASQPLRLSIQWQDSGGGVISASIANITVSTTWAPYSVTGTAPTGATQAAPVSDTRTAPNAERVWNIDACQLEQNSSVTTWVPGTTGDVILP
jgi:hypothetical protein